MLKIRDRLYGKLELPDIAWDLATTCPVLLRLREIRMANIPFLTHPSFANVDRYEHPWGWCILPGGGLGKREWTMNWQSL